ncbi:MAG: UvrD-helicase domain-containing protein [Planctomycetes bacterium]|nr:UvrD-helicase domain-containing protein [Planctomycetota bacterium]
MSGSDAHSGKLVDEAERRRLVSDFGTDLVAVAGAGTGKTRLLTARVLRLVTEERITPDELYIATFTEKAAAEMQERLLKGLAEFGDRDLLRGMEENPAGTFHARARALLEAFRMEAGLPPGFSVMDSDEQASLYSEVFRTYLAAVLEEEGEASEQVFLLSSLGMSARRMEEAAVEYAKHRGRAPALALENALGARPAPDASRDIVSGAIRAARDAVHLVRANPEKPGWCKAAAALERAVELLESRDMEEILAGKISLDLYEYFLEAKADISLTKNDARGKAMEAIAVREAIGSDKPGELSGARGALASLERTVLDHFTRDMAGLFEGYFSACEKEKSRRAALTFDDLLVRLRDLMRDNREVLAAVSGRFRHFLVDEFQDTDPIQLEIVRLAAGGPGGGRLFLVGDPRQSIYHFRGADLRVYAGMREQMIGAGGSEVNLWQNFRSVPGILGFVNAVYSEWAERPPHDMKSGAEPALSYNLEPHRNSAAGSVAVLVPDGRTPGDGSLLTHDAVRGEAAALAKHLCGMMAAGRTVIDPASNEERRFEWGDVAIILQRMTHVHDYEEALEDAGIPCVLEGARTFFTKLEVRSLGAILRAVCWPEDAGTVMGALSSSVLAVPAEDVMSSVRSGWKISLADPLPDVASETLKAAVEYLKVFLPLVPQGLTRLVEAVLGRGGLGAAFGAADPSGARAWALSAFAELVRKEEAAGRGPGEILARFLSAGGAELTLPQAVNVNAVHITTVHKAKGLEWPVVVVADLLADSAGGSGGKVTSLSSHDGRFALAVPLDGGKRRLETPLFEMLAADEREYQAQEWLRKLYVAFTRARDLLVVSCVSVRLCKNAPPSSVRAVDQLVETAGTSPGSEVVRVCGEQVRRRGTLREAVLALDALPDAVAAGDAGILPASSVPAEGAVSEEAVLLGEAFHEGAAIWFRTGVRPRVASYAPPGVDHDRVEELLDNLEALDLPARVAGAKSALVEWPLLSGDGEVFRADLLLLENDGWTVVELKSDRVADEDVPATVEMYRRGQVLKYVRALKASDVPVAGACLVLAGVPLARNLDVQTADA